MNFYAFANGETPILGGNFLSSYIIGLSNLFFMKGKPQNQVADIINQLLN